MVASRGIVTPEAVVLDFELAGLGSRAVAFAVDLGLRLVILYGVVLGFGLVAASTFDNSTVAVVGTALLVFFVVFCYPVVFETFWQGRTPGKAAMGIRVVTTEGAPARFRHAAVRSALGLVDFFLTVGGAAVVAGLATSRTQRLGDLAAGTVAIRERKAGPRADAVVFSPPPGWEDWARALDVGGLSSEQYGLVRSFLLRVHELTPSSRAAHGRLLADKVVATMHASLPPSVPPENFLVCVASAYQARHGGAFAPSRPAGQWAPPRMVR